MVYLPPELRRAVVIHAAKSGRRISDVHAEALGEYIQSRGRQHKPPARDVASAETKPASTAVSPQQDELVRIHKLLDGYGQMIVEIQANTTALVPAVETRALAIVIAALAQSGPSGLSTPQIRGYLAAHRIGTVKVATVCDALAQAGVARCQDNRWFATDLLPPTRPGSAST